MTLACHTMHLKFATVRYIINESWQFLSLQSKGQKARTIRVSYHNGDHYNRQAMSYHVYFSIAARSEVR